MFKRSDSLITGEDRENLESIIVVFNDIFARHRLDIGMNTQFKVNLTQKMTQLSAPKVYQSTNQPQRGPDGRTGLHAPLRNHNDTARLKVRQPYLHTTPYLRNINILNSDDYIKTNDPINTFSDAVQHIS